MRKMAGFTTAGGMNYNPCTSVVPPMELLEKTPFGFALRMANEVADQVAADESKHYTAIVFLKLLRDCAIILVQDAAAMWVLHPERRSHPIFNLPVFDSKEFAVSPKISEWTLCRPPFLTHLPCHHRISSRKWKKN